MLRHLLPLFAVALLSPSMVSAASGTPLTFFAPDGTTIKTVTLSDTIHPGSLTAADLGNDGTAEIIIGGARGFASTVTVVRQDGSIVGSFVAYDARATMGLNVAACDVTGDGAVDIITAPKAGGGPHIRVFDRFGKTLQSEFFAGAQSITSGTAVTCGNIQGDGTAEIATVTSDDNGVRLTLWSHSGSIIASVLASSDRTSNNAVAIVSASDTTEVAVSTLSAGKPTVIFYHLRNGVLSETRRSTAPISVQTPGLATIGNDVVISDGAETKNLITSLAGNTTYKLNHASDGDIAIGTLHEGTVATLLATTHTAKAAGSYKNKKIVVDLSEQKLRAYADGQVIKTFVISSGLRATPTPVGKFSVMAELPSHRYIGRDYDFKNVKWNLRFKTGYYIHTAYWHNNFGRPMSHGCINMREADAKWVYDFANVGTPVEIVR